MKERSRIVVIVGPTASGKSDLALQLAKLAQGKPFQKKYSIAGAEIISADSRQVYKGLDIGTGKVPRDKKDKNKKFKKSDVLFLYDRNRMAYYSQWIRHHLIDVASPKRQFTVAQFKKLAEKAIKSIIRRGKLPIIVGGTGFYIDVLLGRMSVPEAPPNQKLRSKLEKLSTERLFKKLQKLDPKRARTIEPHNKRRLIRALEIVEALGKVPSFAPPTLKLRRASKASEGTAQVKYEILWIGIKLPQKEIEKRIRRRTLARLKQGAVKEVKQLLNSELSKKRIYDFGLGYRAIIKYLDKKLSYEEMLEEFAKSEIQYSKRQMQWFKRNKEIRWISLDKEVMSLIKNSQKLF